MVVMMMHTTKNRIRLKDSHGLHKRNIIAFRLCNYIKTDKMSCHYSFHLSHDRDKKAKRWQKEDKRKIIQVSFHFLPSKALATYRLQKHKRGIHHFFLRCWCTPTVPPPSPPRSFSARATESFFTLGAGLGPPSLCGIQSLAPTSLAQASVEKDLGRSMGAPTARSMMSWGSTPRARETPKRTV